MITKNKCETIAFLWELQLLVTLQITCCIRAKVALFKCIVWRSEYKNKPPKIRCSFIDSPLEKFTGNTAVQRELSSCTRVSVKKTEAIIKRYLKNKITIWIENIIKTIRIKVNLPYTVSSVISKLILIFACVTSTPTKVPTYNFGYFSTNTAHMSETHGSLYYTLNGTMTSFMIQRATPRYKFTENCLTLLVSCYVRTSINSLFFCCFQFMFHMLETFSAWSDDQNALTSSLGCA